MRSLAWALVLLSCLLLTSGREPERHVIHVSNAGELQELFATPLSDVIVQLAPGTYVLPSQPAEIPTGTRNELTGKRPVTVGLRITGRNASLIGPRDGAAELISSALFRVYFDGCTNCDLERVTVAAAASERDSTVGAAILATKSIARIENCVVRANAGASNDNCIVGATGSSLEILSNEISGGGNKVLMVEDGEALVRNNLIEGLQPDGIGILIAQHATVTAERNHLRNLLEGVFLIGSPSLELRANIIEDIRGSGIRSTTRELGRVRIEKNVIFRCGLYGISIFAEGDQRASQNFIVETGLANPTMSGICVHGARADAAVRKNTLYDNGATDADVPREKFWRERRGWTRTYRNTSVGVDGRHRFHESAFLTRYGRWLH